MKLYLSILLLTLISFSTTAQEIMVNKVDFVGLKRLKPDYLRKIINTRKGADFNRTIIKKDLIKLKRLPSVADAVYTVTLTNEGYLIRWC